MAGHLIQALPEIRNYGKELRQATFRDLVPQGKANETVHTVTQLQTVSSSVTGKATISSKMAISPMKIGAQVGTDYRGIHKVSRDDTSTGQPRVSTPTKQVCQAVSALVSVLHPKPTTAVTPELQIHSEHPNRNDTTVVQTGTSRFAKQFQQLDL